ncbi:MAG: cysteine desulfurase [Spirochaetaceae bacterium]|jgi:cysteine desulfurase|nr:cysteine desulfurase [Spirochaetaceae bacterium]
MGEKRIYLDYNATTPLRPEVREAMIHDFEVYGNASSMHGSGRLAHNRVEEAREAVAALIGTAAETITFTSGGSESNNTVFETARVLGSGPDGRVLESGRTEIITTTIEHPCVLNSAEYLKSLGFPVRFLGVDEYGRINLDELESLLSDKTLLVSVMMANNEIGTVQNIKKIAGLVKARGALMHSDGVQATGKIPVNVEELGVDYFTVSAHKIYGPKGIGGLYIRKKAPVFPLIHGGHQEDGRRAGTYNNTGILGFGRAAELARRDLSAYMNHAGSLRDRLREGLFKTIPNIKMNGHPEDTVPNTLNVSFPGAEGESILLSLDMEGIEVSTGSACASGSLEASHVLLAIGVGPELAHGSIRFSLGWGTTAEDIDYTVERTGPIIARLRAMSSVPSARTEERHYA